MGEDLDSSFGFQTVEAAERRARIRRVFAAVAERYDLMNDLMSFAMHRGWKRRFVKLAAPRAGETLVDLAGGTGDVAFQLQAPDRNVIVCDPSVEMMQVGRRRPRGEKLAWVAAEAEALPFPADSIDGLTMSFGLRNVTRLETALGEIARVLKPGGRALILEFSTPYFWVKPFYDLFSFLVIPRLGASVANAPEAYAYLVESIRRFPDQRHLQRLMENAGFAEVSYQNLMLGVVAIHIGRKRA